MKKGLFLAFPTVALGALAYVVASFVRTAITSDIQFDTAIARTADISVLYLITLLPGFVVGRSLARSVVVLGFVAGYAGEVMRNLIYMVAQLVSLPDGMPLSYPDFEVVISVLTHSVPSGILAAAGGALGWMRQQTTNEEVPRA